MKASNTVVVVAAIGVIGLVAWKWLDHASDLPPAQEPAALPTIASAQGAGRGDAAAVGSGPVPAADSQAMAATAATPVSAPAGPGQGPRSKRLAGSAFEASLLTEGYVNSHAMKLLEVKDFGRIVEQLDAQNAGQRNTTSEAYRAQVENTLASFKQRGALDRFACGINVCVASIVDRQAGDWFGDWYNNFADAATQRIGALTYFDRDLAGGGKEHRILFTTLPESGGFMLDPPKR